MHGSLCKCAVCEHCAGKSRFTVLWDDGAALSLMTPERAGLRCQEVPTLTVYLYFPGGIRAT